MVADHPPARTDESLDAAAPDAFTGVMHVAEIGTVVSVGAAAVLAPPLLWGIRPARPAAEEPQETSAP
ncbi:hypothetical protein ACW4TU_00560 [Streptomyces sp. QTS52]